MKGLTQYINERYKDNYGDEILTKEDITLEILQDALHNASFMGDRAYVIIDDTGGYAKIKKDGWQHQSTNPHVLSGIITSKEMWELVKKAPEVKMYLK
jgi:hypothetical protein